MEQNHAKRVALVVEGATGPARVLLDALTRDSPPCRAIVKHDGVQALDYLLCRGVYAGRDPQEVMPCVTLVDLALPGSDGLGLLREMRDHERTRLLPVVAFSSAGGTHHRLADAAYALGVNSYIGTTPGFEPFEESLRRVARYWCEVNDPPPTPLS